MIIGLLIIAIIGLIIYICYLKKQRYEVVQFNREQEAKNLAIQRELQQNEEKLTGLKNNIQTENNILQSLIKTQDEMRKSAQKRAEEDYQSRVSALLKQYEEKENQLSLTFDAKSRDLSDKIAIEADKLAQLQAKQLAYIQAQQRQEEIQLKQDYYKLILSNEDLQDIMLLRDIQPKVRKKDAVDKVIYETYYRAPYNLLMSHLFGPKADKVCGIYKITDLVTGKSYIGQSVDIKERLKTHIKTGLSSSISTNKLYQAMKKDGVENFTFEILEEVPRASLNEREIYWIEFYKTKEYGLNDTKGGA